MPLAMDRRALNQLVRYWDQPNAFVINTNTYSLAVVIGQTNLNRRGTDQSAHNEAVASTSLHQGNAGRNEQRLTQEEMPQLGALHIKA